MKFFNRLIKKWHKKRLTPYNIIDREVKTICNKIAKEPHRTSIIYRYTTRLKDYSEYFVVQNDTNILDDHFYAAARASMQLNYITDDRFYSELKHIERMYMRHYNYRKKYKTLS